MKKISLPTLAEVKAGKVNLAQLEAYAAIKKKAGVSKPPIDNEYHQAMSERLKSVNDNIRAVAHNAFEARRAKIRPQLQAFQDWMEKEDPHLEAYSELTKILKEASHNPAIKRSEKILDMVTRLLEMFRDVTYYKYDQLEAVLGPVIKKENSKQASIASKKMHEGYSVLKRKCIDLFMLKEGQWNSIAAAVAAITPQILEFRAASRSLAKSNAAITIRGWLIDHVATDKDAPAKLTEKARSRLKKGKALNPR